MKIALLVLIYSPFSFAETKCSKVLKVLNHLFYTPARIAHHLNHVPIKMFKQEGIHWELPGHVLHSSKNRHLLRDVFKLHTWTNPFRYYKNPPELALYYDWFSRTEFANGMSGHFAISRYNSLHFFINYDGETAEILHKVLNALIDTKRMQDQIFAPQFKLDFFEKSLRFENIERYNAAPFLSTLHRIFNEPQWLDFSKTLDRSEYFWLKDWYESYVFTDIPYEVALAWRQVGSRVSDPERLAFEAHRRFIHLNKKK